MNLKDIFNFLLCEVYKNMINSSFWLLSKYFVGLVHIEYVKKQNAVNIL